MLRFQPRHQLFPRVFRFRIFREHADFKALLAGAHRFRATDQAGLFALAKDLARLTADSIDATAIQKIVPPPRWEKWGSLKSLEKLLAGRIGAEKVHDSFVKAVYPLGNHVRITRGDDIDFDKIIDTYYDPDNETDSTRLGGTDLKYGFAGCGLPLVLSHNTPNNSIVSLRQACVTPPLGNW